MATPLMLKTFALNELIWKWGPYVKFRLNWNPKQQQFQVDRILCSTIRWLFFALLPQLSMFALDIYLLSSGLFHPIANTPLNWIMTASTLVVIAYCVGINLYFIWPSSQQENLEYVNATLEFSQKHRGSLPYQENGANEPVDKLGIISLLFSLVRAALPFMLEIFTFGFLHLVGIRIDPIYLLLVNVCDMETVSSLYSFYCFLLPVMTFYLFVLSEISRLVVHSGVGLIVITYCTIQTLIKISKEKINLGIQDYKQLTIIQSIGVSSNSFIVLMAMGVGYCILVFYSAVTIIGLRLLPLQIYWIFPLITLLCVIILLVALPNGTKCFNISSNLIQRWD